MRGSDTLHALQRFQTALRLARLARLRAEALDERLHMFYFALLTGEERSLLGELRGALVFECGVVTAIGMRLTVLDVHDAVGNAVEELPVVCNQKQRAGILAQPGFEPQDGVEV